MPFDRDGEMRKFRMLLAGLALLLVGGYFSYEEAVYLVQGRTATAAVTKVTEGAGRGRSVEIEFAFSEPNGTARTGRDFQPMGWKPPPSGLVHVQYTPGASGQARLAGNVRWLGVGLFALAVAVLAFFLVRLLREAAAATRSAPRRRSTRRDRY